MAANKCKYLNSRDIIIGNSHNFCIFRAVSDKIEDEISHYQPLISNHSILLSQDIQSD